jgi:DnaJ-domain-containing protein 1
VFAILKIVLMAAVAAFCVRWLRRQLAQRAQGPAPKPTSWSSPRQTDEDKRSRLKVLRFSADPLEVLGLKPGASTLDIESAYERARAENDPTKLAQMGDEIRTVAARRHAEIERAYRQLVGEE